jgi:hypothetical protein
MIRRSNFCPLYPIASCHIICCASLSHAGRKSYRWQMLHLCLQRWESRGISLSATLRQSDPRSQIVMGKSFTSVGFCSMYHVCSVEGALDIPIVKAQPCLDRGISKQRRAKCRASTDRCLHGPALQRARSLAREGTSQKSGSITFSLSPCSLHLTSQMIKQHLTSI